MDELQSSDIAIDVKIRAKVEDSSNSIYFSHTICLKYTLHISNIQPLTVSADRLRLSIIF